MASAPQPQLPLFYKDLMPLNSRDHAGWHARSVDRARWAEANIEMFRHLVGDLLPPTTLPGAARLGGEELGVMLSYLSTKVLGQYDPFTPAPTSRTIPAPSWPRMVGNAPSGSAPERV